MAVFVTNDKKFSNINHNLRKTLAPMSASQYLYILSSNEESNSK